MSDDNPLVDHWWLDRPIALGIRSTGKPTISIVVPSYNYGRYLEDCLRSILAQDYPHREVLVLDGGSTDDSRAILERYAEHLDFWRCAPDGGQTAAINEGFARSTGDIFVWLNADDAYASPSTLSEVAAHYEAGARWIAGEYTPIDGDGRLAPQYQDWGLSHPVDFRQALYFWHQPCPPQPCIFIGREFVENAFPLSEDLDYIMDYEFFLRVLLQKPVVKWTTSRWVYFRYHGENKTMRRGTSVERAVRREYDRVFPALAGSLGREDRAEYEKAYRVMRSCEVIQNGGWKSVFRVVAADRALLRRRVFFAALWRRLKYRSERASAGVPAPGQDEVRCRR